MKRKQKRKRFDGPIHGAIAKFREKRGMTQEDLAKIIGVDKTAVSHWETGFARPDVERLADVADALGTTVDKLLEAA